MPEVTMRDSTFARLQRHARPLVDDIDAVVNRAIDALEQSAGSSQPENEAASVAERRIDPRALPNLDADVEGQRIAKSNWNVLLQDMLPRAMKRVHDIGKLRQVCPVNMVKGRKTDEGYTYLSNIAVSVQGQDANSACRAVVTAAQSLGIALNVAFMWRHKEGASYPGERARLTIPGATAAKRMNKMP
jgi:hypothetical protein